MKKNRLISLPAVICLFLPLLHAYAQDTGGALSAEKLWEIKHLGAPDISPDGKWAAVPVTEYDVPADKAYTNLWLVPAVPGEARRLTSYRGSDSSPVWSPDGKWIAFESRRGEDTASQIYLIPVDGGEAVKLTDVPTGASGVRWFPDSKKIAFITRVWADLETWDEMGARIKERKDSKVSARTWDTAPLSYWDHWLDEREPHIYTLPIESGCCPKPVTLGTGYFLSKSGAGRGSYDISPDGKEIAFSADIDKSGVDSNFDVFVVDANGGQAKNITTENPGSDGSPQYSPDGRWIAFQRQVIKGFYADTRRLVLHERKSGQNTVITADWDRSAGYLCWAPNSQFAYASIDDAGHERIYRIDLPSGKVTPITKDKSFGSLSLSADGRTLAALRQGFSEPNTLVRINTRTGEAVKLSAFNDEILADVKWGTYESVTYQGANDQDIQMWVIYPPDFDPDKQYPLYLLLHGGPHSGITDSFHARWNAQVFAGWGYVTAWHNFHGSSGFGQDFTDAINPDQSELPYFDTIKAAEYFAFQSWIDSDRMAAGGGSYGGYLASILLGREHPFKTFVAHAAVFNWYTQYGADYGAGKRRFGEFWKTPDHYKTSSPHYGAGHFNTPTLVIHGQLDYRVPLNHGIELFNILQNRGIKSRFVYYPDENHWILKPNNSIHWYGEKEKWLGEWIGE